MDLGTSEPFVHTGAFCRALDREEEFDAADELAARTLHGGGGATDAKPALNMEVWWWQIAIICVRAAV